MLGWANLAGSAVSAIGGLIGGKSANDANLEAVKQTNAANKSIAQMNNAYNERMMKEQMRYNTMMWEKENEYNTAANQAQRLRQAGLNPALVMSGQNAGTAGSVGGITPPTASPVTMQTGLVDNSYIGASLDRLSQGFQTMQQLQNEKARISIEQQNANARLVEVLSNADNKRVLTQGQKILNSYLDQQEHSKIANLNADTAMKNAQKEYVVKQGTLIGVQTLIATKQFNNMDELHQQQIAEIGSRIALNLANKDNVYASANLSRENVKKVSQEIKNLAEQGYGIKLSNAQALMLTPYVIRSAQNAANYPDNDWYWMFNDPTAYGVHTVGGALNGGLNISKKLGK